MPWLKHGSVNVTAGALTPLDPHELLAILTQV